ncbi:hypothetical protein SLA2020_135200 [Shorea laevis]
MASSSSTLLPPVRCISLPSRVHPTSLEIEAALNHLKSWQISSASAETLQHGLVGLAEMYNCLQDFIQSSQSQRALLQYQNGNLVDEALNESVVLLDSCDAARDALVTMQRQMQSLQSALRRRRRDSSIEAEVAAYLNIRKKVRKEISIRLGTIKKLESKFSSCLTTTLDASDHDASNVARVLREASSITISVLRSVLVFLSMPGGKMGTSPLSLISKLIRIKSLSYEKGQDMVNEVGSVDLALCSLLGHLKTSDPKVELQMVQRMLENLDVRIEDLETGLDCIFKCLIQNRVTLLNIITN